MLTASSSFISSPSSTDFHQMCFRGITYSNQSTCLIKPLDSGVIGQYRGQKYSISRSRVQTNVAKGLKYRGIAY